MKLQKTVYIQIFKNRARLYCLDTNREEIIEDLEFSNERFLICSFNKLYKRVKKACMNIIKEGFFPPLFAPIVIIHPMIPNAKNLCEVEINIFKSLVYPIAREKGVIIYLGETLKSEQMLSLISSQKNKNKNKEDEIVCTEDYTNQTSQN